MDAHVEGDLVRLGPDGRERFYDSRGYGRPDDGGLALSLVEAAHLLYRGDLDAVDGRGFREFFEGEGIASRFIVYKDLRDRGFYLSPAREGWVDDPEGCDFVVYPRGDGPWDDAVEYRVRVVAERESVPADALGDLVLAVVDEESELTYLETSRPSFEGGSRHDAGPRTDAALLDDRVVVWEPPDGLYERGFYGQPLDEDRTAVQLSLVEGAYLAERDALSFDAGRESVLDRGREAEGERFDRRLTVYAALRASGVVPKTGFKFGADFRTYSDVSSVSDLGHSERLVRVLPTDHTFAPRDLSLDVRLAHGVRKEMVFAFTDGTEHGPDVDPDADVRWLAVQRLTP
ncbi:tRNA-intron lyase [Halosegnis marinus]|uniref:tRNA-splicing endonuclease n=1 Tax=Halosegnis marinus TaxID=3034023 RepID=A0ABD5ZNE1_9EURY|nr:tRNA-intron lyase [Halosegnis sp. DT85]